MRGAAPVPADIALPLEHASDSDRGSPTVSVIVPVSERPSPLDRLYLEYASPLQAAGIAYEFIYVVPGWGLALVKALDALVRAGEPIRILEVGRGAGESAMLEIGLERAEGKILLTLPAYPRVVSDALPMLLRSVAAGADLATARRVPTRTTFTGWVQNWAFHALLRLVARSPLRDVASGVRAMKREVLEELPIYGDLFRFLPVLAEREGFRVEEISVTQHPEDERARVYSPGVYVRRLIDLLGLFFLIRFTRKPLRFFGLFGSVIAGLGGLVLAVIVVQRIGGEPMADRPLLLLGVLLLVLGIQAIGIGLIGEIIVHLSANANRSEYRLARAPTGRDEA
jgi:hypothetical protein